MAIRPNINQSDGLNFYRNKQKPNPIGTTVKYTHGTNHTKAGTTDPCRQGSAVLGREHRPDSPLAKRGNHNRTGDEVRKHARAYTLQNQNRAGRLRAAEG